jgi:excisionase family DNA binding protein
MGVAPKSHRTERRKADSLILWVTVLIYPLTPHEKWTITNNVTRRVVAKQLSVATRLLLDWIEQREYSNEKTTINDIEEPSFESRFLTAPDVARILNISKGAAYQLIQQRKIPCVRINRNVRVRQEDSEDFIEQTRVQRIFYHHHFT